MSIRKIVTVDSRSAGNNPRMGDLGRQLISDFENIYISYTITKRSGEKRKERTWVSILLGLLKNAYMGKEFEMLS